MNWIDKLERRFPRFGLRNLTFYLVVGYVIGYFLEAYVPRVIFYLTLDMGAVLRGQIWRLVTWVLFPPASSNVFFFALAIIFFYYPIGTSLERLWGTFRYTLYYLFGCLITIIAALIVYLVSGFGSGMSSIIYTTYYITLSVFLAYAMTFPDAQVLLWFIIPIRMSWMAIAYAVILLLDVISNLRAGAWYMTVPIIASLLNFALFTLTMRKGPRISPQHKKRQTEFRQAMRSAQRASDLSQGPVTKHKCAVCGRTEKDNPDLEFRFCSRCNGNYEYCSDHLFTHQHKTL